MPWCYKNVLSATFSEIFVILIIITFYLEIHTYFENKDAELELALNNTNKNLIRI